MQPTRRADAFTLVEVLFSIGVLAVLAFLLMVAVQKVGDSGRAANCVSNLRILGLAMRDYMTDNRGYGVPHTNYAFFETNGAERVRKARWLWMSHLAPYLGDPKAEGQMSPVFACPADELVKRWPKQRLYQPLANGERAHALTSYGYNYYYFTTSNSWWGQKSEAAKAAYVTLRNLANPAGVIIVGDKRKDSREDPAVRNDPKTPDDPIIHPFNLESLPGAQHFGKANVVFLDGHVESLNGATLSNTNRYWVPRSE